MGLKKCCDICGQAKETRRITVNVPGHFMPKSADVCSIPCADDFLLEKGLPSGNQEGS